jgi:hypothetical protein
MLGEFLSRRRAVLVSEWFDRVVDGYPDETARFLRSQADPFANPVGAGLRDELGSLVDGLIAGTDEQLLVPALDRILRVRAVQDMSPSVALGFLFELKELVRLSLGAEGLDCAVELTAFEDRIDRLVLTALDVYARCREQVFEIRVREIRNRSMKMMERLNEWRARRDGFGEVEGAEPH